MAALALESKEISKCFPNLPVYCPQVINYKGLPRAVSRGNKNSYWRYKTRGVSYAKSTLHLGKIIIKN